MSDLDTARRLFSEALELIQQEDLTGARERLLEAHRLVPDRVSVVTNLTGVLLRLGALEAIDYARKSVALDPANVEGWLNLATCHEIEGSPTQALDCISKAIALKPDAGAAYERQAALFRKSGRMDEALLSETKAQTLAFGDADAYADHGITLWRARRVDESVAAFDRAIALDPNHVAAHLHRGRALRELNRNEEALVSCERAIALEADHAEAHNDRGNVLQELKRYEEAISSYDRALALDGGYAEAYNNRGNVLAELKRHQDALASYDQAIALKPDYAEAHNNRGYLLKDLKRYDEAMAAYDRAIALKPDFADAQFNKALLLLARGDFGKGWELYDWRWRTADLASPGERLGVSLWTARERIRGARLLLCAEQGVGDEIMFASLIGNVMREARSVTLECDSRLATLYQRSFPALELIERQPAPAAQRAKYDCVVPLGSLARFYRTSLADFPQHNGYLKPSEELTAKWRSRLRERGAGLKVGISWRGGTARSRSDRRSIPLDHWGPLFEVGGVQFVSLQYGDVQPETARWGDRVIFFPDCQKTFDDLAALIDALDLVISVQTAVVHLTGAIGKTCWAMVSDPAEWRYGQNGSRMPWYPAVTLFRQNPPGDWEPVMQEVAAELARRSKAN